MLAHLLRSVRMRVVCAAAMIVMLAGPAYAQEKPVPKYGEETKDKTPQEKEADKAAERAYQRSLGTFPARARPILGAPCAPTTTRPRPQLRFLQRRSRRPKPAARQIRNRAAPDDIPARLA